MSSRVRGGDNWQNALVQRFDNSPHVKVGVLSGATYSGEDDTRSGQSVAEVAYWNEYGTQTAPARPAFRNTVADKQSDWGIALGRLVRSGLSLEQALGVIGQNMSIDVKDTIKTSVGPGLSEVTIAKKTRQSRTSPSSTLQDTRTLIQAISSEVTNG